MDSDHYIYVVMLRDGYARYLSNYKHVYRGRKRWKGSFLEWWSNIQDNWIFRQICGPDCHRTPKFQLTMKQVDKTLARLRNFDHLMFLEDGDYALDSLFATRFHWNSTIDAQNKAPQKSRVPEGEKNDMSWDPLMVALDDVLYEYARWLTKNVAPYGPWKLDMDMTAFNVHNVLSQKRLSMMDRYMKEGVSRGCKNPCCAEKCSPK